MTATGVPAGPVHDYVVRVRAALADLPQDDVEDLLTGMEADLGELVSESGGDLPGRLGSPEVYAAELRAAAGLPPRAEPTTTSTSWFARASRWVRDTRDDALRSHPWLADLRPVWWVARAGVAAAMVSAVFGSGRGMFWFTAVVFAAGSFILGRVTPRLPSVARGAVLAGDVLAVLLLVPALGVVSAAQTTVVYDSVAADPATVGSLVVNGEAATNLYAYDADGDRLDSVRLFNQFGQAVTVDQSALYQWNGESADLSMPLDPTTGEPDVNRAVFPLRWGARTGWETSSGQWTPPIKIVPLPVPAQQITPTTMPADTPSEGTPGGATASSTTTSTVLRASTTTSAGPAAP